MGKFLTEEKQRYVTLKRTSAIFSKAARAAGRYKHHDYDFCLPEDEACRQENLFPGIRRSISDYFARNEIKWHDGRKIGPSNHLCDSQVCCANFLFPFAEQPEALVALFRPLYPAIRRALPIEDDLYVGMEWIGLHNYLKEKISNNGKRTRGANFTSADAVVMFENEDRTRHVVLIEWKYTETYSPTSYVWANSCVYRPDIYQHLYDRDDFPLHKVLLPSFESLFFEPHYQMFRQQMLAHEMQRLRELDATRVTLLQISPRGNQELKRVTSKALNDLYPNLSLYEVWKHLLRYPDTFQAASVEDVFGKFPSKDHPAMQPWWDYVKERYSWFIEGREGDSTFQK